MTPDEFRKYGYQIIDQIADYREQLEQLPVRSVIQPGDIRRQLPTEPPLTPTPFTEVLHDIQHIVMPGLTHWQHPRFFGYFPANAPLASVLGDLLSTGLGVLGLSWQASPALTEIEEVMLDWMRQMLGLSQAWKGVIQDTASTSTLVSLLCARERVTDFGMMRGGLQAEKKRLIVYVSEQAHSSVIKDALLAGFGQQNVRKIPCDRQYSMMPEALNQAIEADRAKGYIPCAIVATLGTTASTALDSIRPIAGIASKFGIWLHVDAAMGGIAMLLPECRWMWNGIEQADSLVVNAHKWLGAAFDCSLYFVRDSEHLIRVMSTNPSYLQSEHDGQTTNFRDWGIPLGRRFRALKLWTLLRAEGLNALQARIRRDLENAKWLAFQINSEPHWRLVAPVPLQTLCVRHEPSGLAGQELDQHTLAWVERVMATGKAYLTPAQLDGRWMVRISIGAETTNRSHLQELWDLIRECT